MTDKAVHWKEDSSGPELTECSAAQPHQTILKRGHLEAQTPAVLYS